MSFAVAETTLGSAVATSGTFTVSYPAGTSAGDFTDYGHEMFSAGHQTLYTQDAGGISVSFDASEVTVTYRGSTALPADKRVSVQMNQRGADDRAPNTVRGMNSLVQVPLFRIELGSPDADDANGVVESQDLTDAGAFSSTGIAGALASGGIATFDVPRNVVAAWTTTSVLTITGTDEYGNTIVESSASGATLTGKKAFKTVTGVTSSEDITALTVGTGDVLGLPVYLGETHQILAELEGDVQLARRPGVVYLQDRMLEAAVDAGTSLELVSPVAGNIRKLTAVAGGTITTGGAITVEVATVAVNGLSVVVADAASAGDVDSDTATAGHASTAVAVGDRIEIIPAAGFNASADIYVILEIDVDTGEQLDGTFVAGVQTAATATTGDVRGTYSPLTGPDGSTAFSLLAALPDPTYKGVNQYAG